MSKYSLQWSDDGQDIFLKIRFDGNDVNLAKDLYVLLTEIEKKRNNEKIKKLKKENKRLEKQIILLEGKEC